jgi:hypothetical protein
MEDDSLDFGDSPAPVSSILDTHQLQGDAEPQAVTINNIPPSDAGIWSNTLLHEASSKSDEGLTILARRRRRSNDRKS